MRQIITLTTDWGNKDWYQGKIKGMFYSEIKDALVVDITHEINKYDHNAAAFIVRNSCLGYPENTIHIIDVDTYSDKNIGFVVVKYENQFYICTDNDIPYMVFHDKPVEITSIDNILWDSNYYTFAALDVFFKVAKILANTHSTQTLGNKLDNFNRHPPIPSCAEKDNIVICKIDYIDSYGNAYLNIDDDTFAKKRNEREFIIKLGLGCEIKNISQSYQKCFDLYYNDVGKALLTISSTNNLELAMRNDNFAKLMGKKVGDEITIEFIDKDK